MIIWMVLLEGKCSLDNIRVDPVHAHTHTHTHTHTKTHTDAFWMENNSSDKENDYLFVTYPHIPLSIIIFLSGNS